MNQCVESDLQPSVFSDTLILLSECAFIFKSFIDNITCYEIQFMNNFKMVKKFIMDDFIISKNEEMERNVNGIISLKSSLTVIYKDITFMSES